MKTCASLQTTALSHHRHDHERQLAQHIITIIILTHSFLCDRSELTDSHRKNWIHAPRSHQDIQIIKLLFFRGNFYAFYAFDAEHLNSMHRWTADNGQRRDHRNNADKNSTNKFMIFSRLGVSQPPLLTWFECQFCRIIIIFICFRNSIWWAHIHCFPPSVFHCLSSFHRGVKRWRRNSAAGLLNAITILWMMSPIHIVNENECRYHSQSFIRYLYMCFTGFYLSVDKSHKSPMGRPN